MAYSELIKNFDKIRDYMRDFFIFGFKTRNDFDKKSARSYDNERRRVESWLYDYMSFRQDSKGKNVFISVDSREVVHNPLYKAYKAKTFTDKDIILHFYIMDILADGSKLSVKNIAEKVSEEYLSFFDTDIMPDDSTIRNKLKEYTLLGLVKEEKAGKEVLYSRTDSDIRMDTLSDAIAFSAEYNPSGVIGSYLLDKYKDVPEYFSFKHHYLLEALDQEILIQLLLIRKERRIAQVTFKPRRDDTKHVSKLYPLKIYVSTQNGKQYLMAYSYGGKRPKIYRLDRILSVKPLEIEPEHELLDTYVDKYATHMWGTSDGYSKDRTLEHVELDIHVGEGEDYIIRRLEREKRQGEVIKVDSETYRFQIDVYDANEMVPWIRTFIGRIERFECSNESVTRRFFEDVEAMKAMYGGDDDGI